MRRSLGFDLFFAERVLRKFAEFADRERADHITSICSCAGRSSMARPTT